MTADELDAAKSLIANLRLPLPEVATRRTRPARRGSTVDARATLRAMTAAGGDIVPLRWRAPELPQAAE